MLLLSAVDPTGCSGQAWPYSQLRQRTGLLRLPPADWAGQRAHKNPPTQFSDPCNVCSNLALFCLDGGLICGLKGGISARWGLFSLRFGGPAGVGGCGPIITLKGQCIGPRAKVQWPPLYCSTTMTLERTKSNVACTVSMRSGGQKRPYSL